MLLINLVLTHNFFRLGRIKIDSFFIPNNNSIQKILLFLFGDQQNANIQSVRNGIFR